MPQPGTARLRHLFADDGVRFAHRTSSGMQGKERNMNIVVSIDPETGEIFQHFGRTAYFKLYDVQGGKVMAAHVESTEGSKHGALVGALQDLKADILICGGIGGGAQNALRAVGIQIFGGCTGSADGAVRDYLAGNLHFQADVHCDHHEGHGEAAEGCHCHGTR